MNLRKLPKEKRDKLIMVVLGTLVLVAALYFLLINRQNRNLAQLAHKKTTLQASQRRVLDAIHRAGEIETDLAAARKALTEAEADIASGDLYAWVVNWLRQFKSGYKVEIPQINPLGPVTDVNLVPNFPYKQTLLTVTGTTHFHDLGRFLADLENQFPHVRILNLTLDANAPSSSADPELLSFRMDIVTLVKPNQS
jgi:Tfp pilus assembly protein PilO